MLGRLGFSSAALDAKLLTGHALRLSTLELATRENEPADSAGVARVADLLQRRMSGESVARIIGARAFYGLDFLLNEATLEPRPETELLVDLALGALPAAGRLLDLGTGTGCIPIAVLANQPDAVAVAVDLSGRALEAARDNAARHGMAGRIDFLKGSWFEPLTTSPFGGEVDPTSGRVRGPLLGDVRGEGITRSSADLSPRGRGEQKFDLIVSNPPYISSAVVETLAPEVKDFDPRLALDGGPDGLAPYRIIAKEASDWLAPEGWVLVEIGFDQGAAVSALFLEAGYDDVTIHTDLNGLDRVVAARHI
ncbi:MAG: peptide chain release factor N(5)-glutamine methyltransferase [Alphaproteobacteria bacterium]|nr:peptide chain release factor N(5)-glutamine methyltransferase [Alphaproteobacteria bacterium]MBU1561180.1 peptide chain release factor N(5)-glutamine methyltransferase [Alphaproteobacteria bacterium]MBU2302435.1 peptide chain release factor N(5)-glutamine methyltransferase [Alphaproteobacteria bacterium]MBU2368074.1 peptide chain release factor N(5)-glutamine methyltransferase [Alphaproteobacteria bacterium]